MEGKLYLVATPIGNLEDITFRALRILKEVDIIAAEDTRHTLKLLNYYEISKKMISYHRHNEDVRTDGIIDELKQGKNIAIVTDAGTPAISDPGEVIVKKAIEEQISVIPIPGACAFVNALIASGLDTNQFVFYGFLPMNKKLRKKKFEEIEKENKTIILYEAPHKLKNTLSDIYEVLGDRFCVLAKEITKIHENFTRLKVSDLINDLGEPKGEYILLIEGQQKEEEKIWETFSLEDHYEYYEKQYMDKKEIIKRISRDRKTNKNEIYMYFLNK